MSSRTRVGLAVFSLLFAAPALGVAPAPAPVLCPLPGQTGTCLLATPVAPLLPATQPKYVNELPQPVFYNPDKSSGVFDYYEIFSGPAGLGLANPKFPFDTNSVSTPVPGPDTWDPALTVNNKVWLGLTNPVGGAKLYTEVWGYGQQATAGATPVLGAPIATYPAMSFRAERGRPVKVKWINKLPNQHMFCKKPTDSNYPCAIDRSLMGTLVAPGQLVGQYGGPQQADNAMVVHLHGGEIPPDSDGFAELWFGNSVTAAAYTPAAPSLQFNAVQNIDPVFQAPAANGILAPIGGTAAPTTWDPCNLITTTPTLCKNAGDQCVGNIDAFTPGICYRYNGNSSPTGDPARAPWLLGSLVRPTGDSMIYNYPMVQDSATIWYHDHALGKTRINVAAGPAGYFYVEDPAVDPVLWGSLSSGTGYFFGNCSNAGILAGQCRDVPIVLQDRAFNADGSINFPNLLGQIAKNKFNPLTPGPNPTVHPQWVPEYFGDMAVVNGITWPKLTVSPGAYRFRLLDGSNARCYVMSLTTAAGLPGPSFKVIGSDQGYLPNPVTTPTLTMCPGERYDVVVDFTGFAAGTVFNLTNTGGAPFPAGITPQFPNSPDAFLASMMQFVVAAGTAPAFTAAPGVTPQGTWNAAALTALQPTLTRINAFTTNGAAGTAAAGVIPPPLAAGSTATRRFFALNEVLDPLTKAPLRVQIDGKPFEAPVTETPKRGTTEVWDIANTTVDAHPMHLHLVQFKVIGRWNLDINKYTKAAVTGFPPVVNKAIDPWNYVIGAMLPPEPGEQGLKDTARSMPGQLLRVIATWDGGWKDNAVAAAGAPFYQPVTAGPYVWHCHIVDHEDNEMMRPSLVVP